MVHINLIAITYLISDHDRDCLGNRGSRGVVHTIPIAIVCRGTHQHVLRYTVFRSGSHVVVHMNLIAITCRIADYEIGRVLDRDRLADLGFLHDRLIASIIAPMTITPSS